MNKNKTTFYKVAFYFSLTAVNVIALSLIGLSFLVASNANGEGAPLMTESETFIKRSFFALVISLLFAGIASLVSFLFRNVNRIDKRGFKRIFYIEFCAFILIYLIVYGYLYLRFAT